MEIAKGPLVDKLRMSSKICLQLQTRPHPPVPMTPPISEPGTVPGPPVSPCGMGTRHYLLTALHHHYVKAQFASLHHNDIME